MRNNPQQRINAKAVSYWRWSAGIKSGFLLLISAGYHMAQQHWHWPAWISFVLLGLTLAYAIYAIILKPDITWRTWRYNVSEQEIDLLHGVFIRTRTLIPMVRVQHVDTEQGPLLRRFGLSSVSISTAAGSHEIPALADEVAALLRDQISVLARVVDEDV
ncbi:MAG: PH domain-containing protein [Syntrophomonadaceae bacterium]|nr:PH domain-containing protein [Syntrophomonadaceae bacterium]